MTRGDAKAVAKVAARLLARGAPRPRQPEPAQQSWAEWAEEIARKIAGIDPMWQIIADCFAIDEAEIGALGKQVSEAKAHASALNDRVVRLEAAVAILQAPRATLVDHYRDPGTGQIMQTNIFSNLPVAPSAGEDRTALPHATAYETAQDLAELDRRLEAHQSDTVNG
jgi:hypothetical protein